MMPAQNLPPLAQDASIQTGALPNGISYYLVTNPSKKGMADFALVRKGLRDTLAARKELTSLPHFNKTVPYRFLSRKGIGCGKDGFISYKDENTIFRFEDVPMFDQAASDTTLLMLFDLIAEQPFQHSIVIAGDINPGAILQKMNVFSLMVPARNPTHKPAPYAPVSSEKTEHIFIPSDTPRLVLDFRSQRTPPEMMGTIQPFIVKVYGLQTAEIIKARLEDKLSSRGIPYSDLQVAFHGSDTGNGDDHLTISFRPSSDKLVPASLALASAVSELASRGPDEGEFVTSKKTVISKILAPGGNSGLVDRCVSSYLYGSDLAAPGSKVQFLTSRVLDTKKEAAMFKDYVEAVLGDIGNASLTWSGDRSDFDGCFVPAAFDATWSLVGSQGKPTYSWNVSAGDSLSLWPAKDKVKLKTTETEPVSGGQMWTFSNGMKVVYKKTTSDRTFRYSLMIRGGFSSVKGASRGEGAFFSDMLSLCDIAGMPGEDFFRMLSVNGIEMSPRVSVSDLKLSGSAPSDKLSLLMKSLLSIANDRRPDQAAFNNYLGKAGAVLKTAYLDSLLYPGFGFSSVKTPSGLTSKTLSLASSYFDSQFIRVNDGVLVLMGDLDPDHLQKFLCRCLGGFRVSGSPVLRPSVQYKLPSGSTTYSQAAAPPSINIAIAAATPFTIENNMAFRVAVQALQRSLAGVMGEAGFSVCASHKMSLSPQESVEAILTLTPVPECGMPLGRKGGEARMMEGLRIARKTIDKVLSSPLPANEFNACKAIQVNRFAAEIADQDNYIDAVLMRYSNAKDVLTGFNDRINSVSQDQVQRIFGVLAGGRRIEYVVKE